MQQLRLCLLNFLIGETKFVIFVVKFKFNSFNDCDGCFCLDCSQNLNIIILKQK